MKVQHRPSSQTSSNLIHQPRASDARGSKTLLTRGSWTRKIAAIIGAAFMIGTALLGFAEAAPKRADWCGTIWSIENTTILAWLIALARRVNFTRINLVSTPPGSSRVRWRCLV
jgi:hypothetical protein